MTMDLSFLGNVKLEPVKKEAPKVQIVKLPEEADIRVFPSGKVLPSKAFAELTNLEFTPKVVVIEGSTPEVTGNGIDIFSSKDWNMVAGQLPTDLLFCYLLPKSYPKVSLWGSCKYNEDGTPKSSIFTQGPSTFVKARLLSMLEDVYKVDWNTTLYVDLTLATENIISSPTGLYDIPSIVASGKGKGNKIHIRRQNISICPIVIHEIKSCLPKGEVIEQAPKIEEVPVKDPVTFDTKVEVPKAPETPQPAVAAFEQSEDPDPNPIIPDSVVPTNPLFDTPPPSGNEVATKQPDAGKVDPNVGTTDPGVNWSNVLGAVPPVKN